MIHVNKIDNIITKCMLKAENKLKHSSHSHPWSPTLAFAILEVRLWKLITSSLYTLHRNTSRIETVQARMRRLAASESSFFGEKGVPIGSAILLIHLDR